MGFEVEDRHGPNQTPKLTLSKLPFRKPIRSHPHPMRTPPFHQPASVPFRWEVAPGKPIPTAADGGKCNLDLPPRLVALHDHGGGKITRMPSPATVLDGPYVGRSLSLACTFSFRRPGREDGARTGKRGGGGGKFGSGRWGRGSYVDEKRTGKGNLDISHSLGRGSYVDEKKIRKGNLDISHSLGDFFRVEKDVKVRRGGKRKGLLGLWGDVYGSFKQAIRWRRAHPIDAKKEHC